MTNAELIACIQAEERGEVVEAQTSNGQWIAKAIGVWIVPNFTYRIRREPRKCWVTWNRDGKPLAVSQAQNGVSDTHWIKEGWQLVVEDVK